MKKSILAVSIAMFLMLCLNYTAEAKKKHKKDPTPTTSGVAPHNKKLCEKRRKIAEKSSTYQWAPVTRNTK